MRNRAFTLVELLVVIVIGALLIGIAIPSFRALLSSSRESLAQNALQQAIYSARDIATQNLGGGDAAAVFFYDRDRGLTIGVYEQVATIMDDTDNGSGLIQRDVFVPVPTMEAVRMPPGHMVRGFVLGTQLRDEDWYEDLTDYDPASGTIQPGNPGNNDRGPGAWVFPETDFYDQLDQTDGADRQTFMIRFEAGTGAISRESTTALIIDPRPSFEDRPTSFQPINQAEDLRSWTVRASVSTALSDNERAELIGNESGDTVLARPVTDIALYRERRMGQMLGLRSLNRQTDTIYQQDDEPRIDRTIFRDAQLASDRAELESRITQWIEGRLALQNNNNAGSAEEADSSIYTISSYFGDLVEVNR